jgi:hypothetical protein
MRQKVGYLESVNAELCEQLERCDAEALNHQGGLQAEKAELAARMRQLQEEVRWPVLYTRHLQIKPHEVNKCVLLKPLVLPAHAISGIVGIASQLHSSCCAHVSLGVQVVRLQERSSSYLAELDELKTARSSKSLLGTVAGDAQAGATVAVAAVAAKPAAADKELMLKQIDSLKEVCPYLPCMRHSCPSALCIPSLKALGCYGSARGTACSVESKVV